MLKRKLSIFYCIILLSASLSVFCFSSGNPLIAQAQTATNIIMNGGFETGVIPWHLLSSDYSAYTGSIEAQRADVYLGVQSGNFTITKYPREGGYVTLSQNIRAQVGETFTLTFYYKNDISFIRPHVFCKDRFGNDIAYFAGPVLSVTNQWTQASMSFGPIPVGTEVTEVHFDPAALGTLLIDDVSAVNNNPNPPSLDVINVPSAQYPTIQSALYGARDGTKIIVASGVYNENVSYSGYFSYTYLNQVTLQGSEDTVINGDVTFAIMRYLTMDGFKINGLLKVGIVAGGYIQSSTFSNLDVKDVEFVNAQGVVLRDSNVNHVQLHAYAMGSGSTEITIQNNRIHGGVTLGNSAHNIIINNEIENAEIGVDDTTQYANWHVSIGSNQITGNTISNCKVGINLHSAMMYTSPDTITQNTIKDCNVGVQLVFKGAPIPIQNTFSLNNFVNNGIQVNYTGSEADIWSGGTPPKGNYWSDYKGVDANNDGVGDTPYVINANNRDDYPLMVPFGSPPAPTPTVSPTQAPTPDPSTNPTTNPSATPNPTPPITSPTPQPPVVPETTLPFVLFALIAVSTILIVISKIKNFGRPVPLPTS